MAEVCVVIPVFNEEQSLVILLPELLPIAQKQGWQVVVVDDGSTDQSAFVVERLNVNVLRQPNRTGGGEAIAAGVRWAADQQLKWVVTMDGDGQHQPCDLERIVNPLVESGADIVVGVRCAKQLMRISPVRAIGLRVFNLLIFLLRGPSVRDCSSGFRGFRIDRYLSLSLKETQYHTAEFLISAHKAGFTIAQVPINSRGRAFGNSKKGSFLRYSLGFMRSIIRAAIV